LGADGGDQGGIAGVGCADPADVGVIAAQLAEQALRLFKLMIHSVTWPVPTMAARASVSAGCSVTPSPLATIAAS
jgi:hypothetical protein